MKVIVDIIRKFTGVDLVKVRESIDKAVDYACPTNMPSTAEATSLYLADRITIEQWECYVRASNDTPAHFRETIEAQRPKLSAGELQQLLLRGAISPDMFRHRLRQIGWLKDGDSKELEALAYQTPTPSDLIPMMVRDVFDQSIIDAFKLDAEFEAKFGGDAGKLFKAAGLTKDIARLHWMAHWKQPSVTQLTQMFWRLRGGKEETEFTQYYDNEGNKLATPQKLSKDDLHVSEEMYQRALAVNDIAPIWRSRLASISRPTLTRIDVRRAYDIDAITREQVYESYRDLGYDDARAKILTDFTDLLKKRGDIKRKGLLPVSTVIRLYKSQSITKEDAKSLLIQAFVKEADASEAIRQADIEVKARVRNQCVRSIRKRFMIGDLGEDKLVAMLMEQGLDTEQAVAIRDELKCSLALKTKEATAQMLCEWYSNGLVEKSVLIRRLVRLGFAADDARRIADSCEIRAIEKSAKSKGEKGRPAEEREKRRVETEEGKTPEGEIPAPKQEEK